MCFNQIPKYYFLLDLVISPSSSSTICHQRAFSLPQNSNLNVINNQTAPLPMLVGNSSVANGTNAIQPVHQRTRSLPLTEETAIDFSQSPSIFARFSPATSFGESSTNPKINNNSMESIIEDYHSVDMSNNNGSRLNNGSTSILKQLSKVASSKTHNSASSPSQLRKKRQHHNLMTASLRSTYQYHQKKTIINPLKNHFSLKQSCVCRNSP